jgi:light-regulated signal transduction histidine kinase (bacteriophytochrome)
VDAAKAAVATATIEALVRRYRRERAAIGAAGRTAWDEAARLRFDFDAFAYAVSHDLRAPVRSIDGFSAALLDTLGAGLDGKSADYLQRVRAAARKLADMIDALLELSRVSRVPLAPQPTDLAAQIRAAANSVGRRYPQAPVLIAPAGLDAVVDPGLTQKLFERVIDNCCKFAAKGVPPSIAVEVHDTPAGREYRVRDNGVGFEPVHAGKLFRPFQRLHAASEFPGLGIGLVLVQRIVERHGGRVAIDGHPGAGTTLRFTLAPDPRREEGGER